MCVLCQSLSIFASDWEEELELWWKLILSVKLIREIDSAYSAVSMDLNSEGLDVVSSVGSPCEVTQIELNLIPSFIQSHRHSTDEGFHSCRALIVACSESPSDILVIKHLHFECEVFLQVLDDHYEEGQFDSECFVSICGTCNVVR